LANQLRNPRINTKFHLLVVVQRYLADKESQLAGLTNHEKNWRDRKKKRKKTWPTRDKQKIILQPSFV